MTQEMESIGIGMGIEGGSGASPSLSPPVPADNEDVPYILIADDDEAICQLLMDSLQEHGDYRIQIAGNGRVALEECERETPDLILIDSNMPEMTGFEFIEKFRRRPEAAGIPILIVSGFGDLSDRIHGLDLGAVDFVSKPFHPMEVVLRVRTHLENRQLYKNLERQREYINEQAGTLEAILNAVPSGLAVLDGELRVILHNPQFGALFSHSHGDIENKNISELCRGEVHLSGEGSGEWKCPLRADLLRTLHEGDSFRLQEIVFPSSESEQKSRYMIVMATRFFSRNDRLLLDIRDFTSHKETERKLAHRDRLAMLGELSMGVAHEINNPNAFIRLNAGNMKTILHSLESAFERIIQTDPDSKAGALPLSLAQSHFEDAIEGILKATERITIVVDRLKSFGRAGKPVIERVNLAVAVENALAITTHQIKQIEETDIRVDGVSLPPVLGSQVEYEQVVINLLANASQAIETRRKRGKSGFQGRLSLWFEQSESFVELFVSDNGIGMSEATAAKIFTPYFTTKERGQGTGLGLSISHGIVSKYGGRIEVESAPNRGTVFKISLPAAESAEAADIENGG